MGIISFPKYYICCAPTERCGTPRIGPQTETPKHPNEKDYKTGRANNNIQENVIHHSHIVPSVLDHAQTIGRSTRRDTKHNNVTVNISEKLMDLRLEFGVYPRNSDGRTPQCPDAVRIDKLLYFRLEP